MVGIVIVSHSKKLGEGIYELAQQMVINQSNVRVAAGMADGGIGTDVFKIKQMIEEAETGEGVLVLADLGSSILSTQMAMDFIEAESDSREKKIHVKIADAPIVEGTISAVVEAASGSKFEQVLEAAEAARQFSKR